MPCFHPITAYRSREVNPSGKRGLVFKAEDGLPLSKLEIPCGQCVGCRLERSRQWAMRCVHEASLHEHNCFITLTYAPEFLPSNLSLDKADFQKFMKRLRKHLGARRVRYFHCGEYGEENGRPHYHACLFGFDFPDRVLYSTRGGVNLYSSEVLSRLWGKGLCTVGDVTFESAAYVARYIMKKVTGSAAAEHYRVVDAETGELCSVVPEYTTMSRRPGLGSGWYRRFSSDCYPSDFVVLRGVKMRPPRFYDGLYELSDADGLAEVKSRRKKAARVHKADQTSARLCDREKCKRAQIKSLKRSV